MAGFFSTTNAVTETRFTQLQIQTSAQGTCMPICWGVTRIGGNLIWYNNFQSTPVKQDGGKGGGGGKGGNQYTYSAAIILALCEGAIESVGLIWADRATTTLAALGLTLYLGTQDQTPFPYVVSAYPAEALAYAETAYVASSDYQLGSSANMPSQNYEVARRGTMAVGPNGFDVNPADIMLDLLTNTQYGPGLDPSLIGDLTSLKNYCGAYNINWSPSIVSQEQVTSILQRWAQISNSWIFWSGDQIKFVPLGDTTLTANGFTFTANNDAIYNLDYQDFVTDSPGSPPVTVTIADPVDLFNNVEIDILDRNNNYNSTPVYWQDQNSVDQYGVLQATVVEAQEICDLTVGGILAALIGKRAVNVAKTYEFTLNQTYILLEPGDIVTITDPNIGIVQVPVRIQTVSEDDQGMLQVVAEEFPFGIGTANPTQSQTWGAQNPINMQVAPPDANTPAIFEPSPALTAGVPQVWIAASGGANWGGCFVYLSFDNTTFSRVGQITSPSLQGELTAVLPFHADPDTVDTLSIDLAEMRGVMPATATTADADAFRTLCLVGTELLAYGSVMPTGAFTSDLTYLRRGLYGSTIASHTIGSPFTRVNPTQIVTYDLPEQYVGAPLYVKLVSYNNFGNQLQDISAVTTYSFSPSGIGYFINPPTGATLAVSRQSQSDGTTFLSMDLSWTGSPGPLLGSYIVEWSTDGGSTWSSPLSYPASATKASLVPAIANTNYKGRVAAVSASGIATSAFATSATVNSGSLVSSAPGVPTGLSVSIVDTTATLTWTPPVVGPINYYEIWRAPGLGAGSGSAALVGSSPGPAYTDTALAPFSPYTWFVKAVNSAGASAFSTSDDSTTGGASIPGVLRFYFASGKNGTYTSSESLFVNPILMTGDEVFPAGLPSSLAECQVAPATSVSCVITANGTPIGSVDFAMGATAGTFTLASPQSWATDDAWDFLAPNPADASFAGVSVTFVGTR